MIADKPTLYVDYQAGKIQGPHQIIGRLFANPKAKSWYAPPAESTIAISDPQRLQQTVARLRELGYPVVEKAPPDPSANPSTLTDTSP